LPGLDTIKGQDQAVATLSAFLSSGNIPHALIFSGISGTGKRTAAKAFAMTANCCHRRESEDTRLLAPCERCHACKTIAGDRHPDVHRLKPEGKSIKVAQIRQLRDAIAMKPFEAQTRVVVIEDAHAMNPSAANALLKSLEEPPPHTLFLLLTNQPGRLLPTVISRCQVIRFTPLPDAVLADGLSAIEGLTPAERHLIAALSGGSMQAAEKMADASWRQHRRFVLGIMTAIDTLQPGMLLALAARLVESSISAEETLAIMETWVRDLLVATRAPDRLINVDLVDKITYSATRIAAETSLYRAQAICLARRRLEGNANTKLTMEHLLLDMASGPP
jgi:DNA polymerase-3 subunit delta'